jgi:hypothetical protein
VALNLSRRVGPLAGGPSFPPDKSRIEVGPKLQPSNTIRVAVRYKKEYGYKSDRGLFDPGPSSYSAFSINVNVDSRDRQRDPVLISNQGKMRDTGGFYICDYLVSDVPLSRPITITIGLADPRITPFETWKGGSQTQPPRGYRRVILDGTRNVTLTEREPSTSLVFEMVYDLPSLTSRPPL